MKWILAFVILHFAHSTVSERCHGHACQEPEIGSEEGAAGIEHIEWHYNDKLCLEILLIDCSTHTTESDEPVCGTNDKEYENHCLFAHARCQFLHADEPVNIANLGPCPTTTTTEYPYIDDGTTTEQGTASGLISTEDHSSSNMTTTPLTTTTEVTPQSTTTDPLYSLLYGVFCRDPDSIVCNGQFNFHCGSDGHVYPNDCEMSKAKCTNHDLVTMDMSFCS